MVLSLVLGGKSAGKDLKYRDNLLITLAASKQSLTITNTSLTIQMKTSESVGLIVPQCHVQARPKEYRKGKLIIIIIITIITITTIIIIIVSLTI